MSSSPEEAEPLIPKPRSRRMALLWATTCACCAGGVWLDGFLLTGFRIEIANAEMLRRLPISVPVIVFCAVMGAVYGSLIIGLTNHPASSVPLLLGMGGAVTGTIGGALTVPTVILCREWLSPLASSTLLWCAVGFCAGLVAYRFADTPGQRFQVDRDAHDTPVLSPRDEHRRSVQWVLVILLSFMFLSMWISAKSRYLD